MVPCVLLSRTVTVPCILSVVGLLSLLTRTSSWPSPLRLPKASLVGCAFTWNGRAESVANEDAGEEFSFGPGVGGQDRYVIVIACVGRRIDNSEVEGTSAGKVSRRDPDRTVAGSVGGRGPELPLPIVEKDGDVIG